MRSRRMFFLEIASERTSTKRSAAASVAALSSLKSRKPTESIDIYLYIYIYEIDRSTEWGNSYPRIGGKRNLDIDLA